MAKKSTYYLPTPIGTIAFYGSDNKIASKAVAGIILNEEVIEMKKWYQETGDIRNNTKVMEEISEFFKANSVYEIARMNKIIGCPHEEGIDYPENAFCNTCLFWANRNRFD